MEGFKGLPEAILGANLVQLRVLLDGSELSHVPTHSFLSTLGEGRFPVFIILTISSASPPLIAVSGDNPG